MERETNTRYGTGLSVFVPLNLNTFDLVPSFEYYYHKWLNSEAVSDSTLWAGNIDIHINLPVVLVIVRPYFGTGLNFTSYGSENRFGLNLKSGFYVRLTDRIFPNLQATYRVFHIDSDTTKLNTLYLQAGLRFRIGGSR